MVEIVACDRIENIRIEVFEIEPNALYNIVIMDFKNAKAENKVFEAPNKYEAMLRYYHELHE